MAFEYSFESLSLERTIVDAPYGWHDSAYITADDLDPSGIEPIDDTFRQTEHVNSRTLGTEVIRRSAGRLAIAIPAWGGTFESPITSLETQRIAHCLPAHTLLSINMPGHGEEFRSAAWPRTVRAGLNKGSFLEGGKYIADFLEPHANHSRTVDILGYSAGARSAVGTAAHLSRPVDNLVLYDPPGSAKYPYKEFVERYRQTEGAHRRAYQAASTDTELQKLIMNSERHTLPDALAKLKHGTLYDYYKREPLALAAGTLRSDLLNANLENVQRVIFISPRYSALNNPDDVQKILADANEHHVTTTFEHITFDGSHTFPQLGSLALARLYQAALTP